MELFDFSGVKAIDFGSLKVKGQGFTVNNTTNFNNLNESIQKEINDENIKINNFIKNKEITTNSILKKQSLKVIEDTTSNDKASSSYNDEKVSNESVIGEEDEKTLEEIKKIKITKNTIFNKESIIQILKDYFGLKENLNYLENEIVNFDIFLNHIEDSINKNLVKKSPSKIFMRKRICVKLYKLLGFIVNNYLLLLV